MDEETVRESLSHASDASDAADSSEGPRPGSSIGRFLVLSTLGAGAMGVVVVAYDPELDRKAALKLLREANPDDRGARLWREAQALARLSHPNVVTVYDVGMHEGQVFIAMELVEGRTLRQWLASPRTWRETLRVYEAAGRGLAAAHAVGMVHRDFKPDNAMIGFDGRVRVMDFGLARGESDASESIALHPDDRSSGLLSSPLTKTGAFLGTPAYMAPERWLRGGAATPRSDQFAFCVSLYESLFGERPFAASDIAALGNLIVAGNPPSPPRSGEVPTWLRRVVVRGLARDPAERFDSMEERLAALANDPASRRRRWLGGLAIAGVIGASWSVSTVSEPQRCTDLDAPLRGVWDERTRAEIESTMLSLGMPQAEATWHRVEQGIDAWASSWVDARLDNCEAGVRGEQSAELLDLRTACLDEQLEHLRATLDELAYVDTSTIHSAELAVHDLPAVHRCADAAALQATLERPDDPVLAERVAAIDAGLIVVDAKYEFGRYADALVQVEGLVGDAERLDHAPAMVRARLARVRLLVALGRYDEAASLAERAYFVALGEGMLREAALLAAKLVEITGGFLSRGEEAARWVEHAEATSRASGSDEARAAYLDELGTFSITEADYPGAREAFELELELAVRMFGPEHPKLADVYFMLGNVADGMKELELAGQYFVRALTLRGRVVGPDSPKLLAMHLNLGLVYLQQQRLDEADVQLQRALDIGRSGLGPNHVHVGLVLLNLGMLENERMNYERARGRFGEALEVLEAALGEQHPAVASCLHNLAMLALLRGDLEQATPLISRAIVIKEQAMGAEHPELVSSLLLMAELLVERGDIVTARRWGERALAIDEAVLGPEHVDVARSLDLLGDIAMLEGDVEAALGQHRRGLRLREAAVANSLCNLGDVLVRAGRLDDALEPLERALAIQRVNEALPRDRARLHFALARASWAAERGRDRTRALAEAGTALELLSPVGEYGGTLRRELDAWLAERASH